MSVQAYTKAQVTLVDRKRLLLLVLDGGLTFLERARTACAAGEDAAFGEAIHRAQAIVCELRASLDHRAGGALADRLARLYTFMLGHLAKAYAQRSVRRVEEVIRVLRPIAEAFHEVVEGPAAAGLPA
ncbi:MAG TPA: flagellar export chaperone FliS [Candidatus Binatia bacterium]|nr:flagellar export chaperone FliS [Candidatus Binatia bacterium]